VVNFHNGTKLIDASTISLNDWNTNHVSDSMQGRISDDIQKYGFIGEIFIQKYNERLKKNNVIIDGEHRYLSLLKQGEKTIPAIILDVDDNKAKVLTLRLNLERGESKPDKITDILKSISEDIDLGYLQAETGIPINELEVLTQIKFDEIEQDESKKQSTEKSVTCPFCQKDFKIFK